ncbi:MAG: hypothetical protein SVU94_03835 [Bacteroidota bacterium]|nr:hypothetical protein [Bacteroidota bacterium]
MRTILTSFILVALFSVSVMAQSGTKVIAVVNKADWCPVCEKNGERAMAALMENNKDGSVQFVVNDLTSNETRAQSIKELKKVGVYETVSEFNSTGVVYFFNARTTELINQISVAKSDEKLTQTLLDVKKEI